MFSVQSKDLSNMGTILCFMTEIAQVKVSLLFLLVHTVCSRTLVDVICLSRKLYILAVRDIGAFIIGTTGTFSSQRFGTIKAIIR